MSEKERRAMDTESIENVIVRVRNAGNGLRAATPERVVHAIASTAERVADPSSLVGQKARQALPESSGLSRENIERTLSDALANLQGDRLHEAREAFERAFHGQIPMPFGLAGMVLAGNVFTALLRPLAWSLLLRVPVLVKPSSSDEGLSELFVNSLREVDADLGSAIALFRFAREERAMLQGMGQKCDVLHAWGSDQAIRDIRTGLPATTSFVAHGHGLGAIYVPRQALLDLASAERIAMDIALDVALYDQRGCLSPHFVFVEGGARVSAMDLAHLLGEVAFPEIEKTLPRGPLPLEVGAMQMQWRGLGAVRGELFEGDRWSVTFEGRAPFRTSPGWRNLAVHEVGGVDELGRTLAPLGVHLKALGVSGGIAMRRRVAEALPVPLAPRICEIGQMQRPNLLASADGERPWLGFVRTLDIE